MTEIQEAYRDDTIGRRYHIPIVSKKNTTIKCDVGDIVSINLDEPIGKEGFNKLSSTSQATYIKHIHERFGVTTEQVAAMLGYSPAHFRSAIIGKLKLQGVFKRNGRPSKKQLAAWKKFLSTGTPATDSSISEATKVELKKKSPPPTMFCDCSFTLKGELSVSDIASKIQALVADGTQCRPLPQFSHCPN